MSRVTVVKLLKRLENEGYLSRSGPSTHPIFGLGFKRNAIRTFNLIGLEEDKVWEEDLSRFLSVKPNVRRILNHGLTEMLNNCIDHSGGSSAGMLLSQNETRSSMIIIDNGIGIFEKISASLGLVDRRQAIFELSKGKLTTDPSNHSGEGIFFTSRMFDQFQIEANGLRFEHVHTNAFDSFAPTVATLAGGATGTIVSMSISNSSERSTGEIFNQFMNAPDDYGFSKTIVPMRLAQDGDDQLISRSQAKRLIARFDKFESVVLDFHEVGEIGQAFADELFRVYAGGHPSVVLTPIRMTEQVEKMWRRVTSVKPPQS